MVKICQIYKSLIQIRSQKSGSGSYQKCPDPIGSGSVALMLHGVWLIAVRCCMEVDSLLYDAAWSLTHFWMMLCGAWLTATWSLTHYCNCMMLHGGWLTAVWCCVFPELGTSDTFIGLPIFDTYQIQKKVLKYQTSKVSEDWISGHQI
jgi:hypothetical protein